MNSFNEEMVKGTDWELPRFRLSVAEEDCAVKSGAGEAIMIPPDATFKVSVAEWDVAPLAAVTVT